WRSGACRAGGLQFADQRDEVCASQSADRCTSTPAAGSGGTAGAGLWPGNCRRETAVPVLALLSGRASDIAVADGTGIGTVSDEGSGNGRRRHGRGFVSTERWHDVHCEAPPAPLARLLLGREGGNGPGWISCQVTCWRVVQGRTVRVVQGRTVTDANQRLGAD